MAEPYDPVAAVSALQRRGVDFVVVGAVAAIAQGSPLPTYVLDVTPSREPANVERLVEALVDLDAKLRTPSGPVAFPLEPNMIAGGEAWTLTTSAGPLDLVFVPAGTTGYDDIRRDAFAVDLGTGKPPLVASLRDVIRMKEATGRERDRAQLPALRRTLELIRERERESREQA